MIQAGCTYRQADRQLLQCRPQLQLRAYKVSSRQHFDGHFSGGLSTDVQRFDNHAEGSMTKFCYLKFSTDGEADT